MTGGKIITNLVALSSKGAAVNFNNHSVSNKREYHFNKVNPYPTVQRTWTDILPQIYMVIVKVFIAYLLFQLGYYMGMLGMCICIAKYSIKNRRRTRRQCSESSRGPTGTAGIMPRGRDGTRQNGTTRHRPV